MPTQHYAKQTRAVAIVETFWTTLVNRIGQSSPSVVRMVSELRDAFDLFDKDGDGRITSDELMSVMRTLRQTATEAEIREMIQNVDTDGMTSCRWGGMGGGGGGGGGGEGVGLYVTLRSRTFIPLLWACVAVLVTCVHTRCFHTRCIHTRRATQAHTHTRTPTRAYVILYRNCTQVEC